MKKAGGPRKTLTEEDRCQNFETRKRKAFHPGCLHCLFKQKRTWDLGLRPWPSIGWFLINHGQFGKLLGLVGLFCMELCGKKRFAHSTAWLRSGLAGREWPTLRRPRGGLGGNQTQHRGQRSRRRGFEDLGQPIGHPLDDPGVHQLHFLSLFCVPQRLQLARWTSVAAMHGSSGDLTSRCQKRSGSRKADPFWKE